MAAQGTGSESTPPADRQPPGTDAVSAARQALLSFGRERHAGRRGRDQIPVLPRDGLLPVSEQQRYLWFLHQVQPESAGYNVPAPLRLRGPLEIDRLQAALRVLVGRHESLRTRFGEERGMPYQRIEPAGDLPLAVVDLTGEPAADRFTKALVLAAQEMRAPFDLATGPLARCWLARVDAEEHLLLITAHHIVIDGWSLGLLMGELAACYAGKSLPELTVQPADYAGWQRDQLGSPAFGRQLDYWRQRLAGVPVLEFPADRPRPAAPTGAGGTVERPLPPELLAAARAVAATERVSLLTVLWAAFCLVLQRYTGQSDLAVGSVFAGRTRYELESMVGFFANTLVLRADLAGDPTGRELLARCHDTVLDAIDHQDVPFGTVVEELKPDRLPGRNPLFQTSFTMLTSDILDYDFGELAAEPLPVDLGTARFDLAWQVTTDAAGGATVWVEYSTELFDRGRVLAMIEHVQAALRALTGDLDLPLSRHDILPPAETARLASVNPEPRPHATDGMLLHELVSRQAGRDGGAIAIRDVRPDGSTELSYAELDARANQLAHELREGHRVGAETFVATLLPRGPLHPLAQLAVLKAGGAWVPLDPDHPPARLAQLLAGSGAALVLTTGEFDGLLPAGLPRLHLDTSCTSDRLDTGDRPRTAPACPARPDNAAYLIHTSGTTGRPKAVVVSHRAVVNFVTGVGHQFGIGPADRVLQFANPAFDVSLFDTYAALAHGATSVTAPAATLHDPDRLAELLRRERVSVADLPPAVLGLLEPDNLPDLRALFVGLEAFPAELVNRWRTPSREFHNGYGPTEATVACVDYACPPRPLTAPPPIGRPMANSRVYVLDVAGHLAPIGVPGELYLAGTGLARGYHGQPAATAERFVPCPFEPGERMYATGDIARWNRDGQLEFLGRADRQVKIHGLRIELAEIEQVLTSHPDVTAAAVVLDPARQQLHAYLTGTGAAELPGWLAERLPHHLLPATITTLAALPTTANGKLDRDRLPRPTAEQPVSPPSTGTERGIAEIWQDLLDLPAVGATDSFFSLGGSSLLAMRLISRLRDRFAVTVELRQLFQQPVLSQLAALIDRLGDQGGLDDASLAEIDDQLAGLSEEEIDRLLADSPEPGA